MIPVISSVVNIVKQLREKKEEAEEKAKADWILQLSCILLYKN